MPTHKSYQSYLIKSLKDPAETVAYLDAVLEDDDFEHILLALKHVAEARREMVTPVDQLDTNWDTYHRLIAKGEVPGFLLIANLLNNLGLKLSVTVRGE